jgi:hypothetical protein
MDSKDLTRLLVKLIGAVLVFWYLAWLPSAISAAFQAKLFLQGLLLHFAPAVIPLVLGFLIFMFPATITNKLIDGSKLETPQTLVTELELLALRLLGVFYLFRGGVDLAYHVSKLGLTSRIFEAYGSPPPPTPWTLDLAANMVATIVELCFALWLTLGSQGIINAIHRIRGRDL